MRLTVILPLTLLTLGALTGCSKRKPARATKPAQATAPVATNAATDDKHGTRKLKGLDVPVYVDGVQVSVLRYGDLPPIERVMLDETVPAFRLYDYLKAAGIKPESVKAVHIHGNQNRIGSLEGSEMMRDKKRFIFSFASADTGSPMVRWDTEGLKNEFSVHEIRKMSVFVNKPVPALHKTRLCHVAQDGTCMDGVPYSDGTIVKGTRVYVDGKMVGFVKRRLLAEDLKSGATPAGDDKYSVAKFLASYGVGADVSTVEIVAGDDVIARADGAAWKAQSAGFYFTLPKHNHGKVRMHVPAAMQSPESNTQDRDAFASAVLVYKRTTAPKRELAPISEDTDLSVQLASNDERSDTQK